MTRQMAMRTEKKSYDSADERQCADSSRTESLCRAARAPVALRIRFRSSSQSPIKHDVHHTMPPTIRDIERMANRQPQKNAVADDSPV